MSAPPIKLPDDRLVIALDFGTTYSGVAYAFNVPGKEADVVSIQDWPGLEGHRQPKVPTLIMYDEKDPSKFKWGGQVDWRDPAVRGVKLLLDPTQGRPKYLPTSIFDDELKDLPKDKEPVDVAADFIGAIYKHALSVIESAVLKSYFDFCQKDFILSVPAIWSDKAKELTLMASAAAKKAGIHPVTLIKEPEAAALYTLSAHKHTFTDGDVFVLCDAGGGTVDLITYEIKKTEPCLQLSEVVPGKGGMAGSLLLNKRFEETVRELVGENQFYYLKRTVGWPKALNEFDKNIKTAFNGDPRSVEYVNFPKSNLEDDYANGLSDNCWEMTGKTLQNIFEPTIKDILELVDVQIRDARAKRANRDVKAIFLVGGFGSSRYLKGRLELAYQLRGIQVVQPHDAWGAIVNGAVLSRVSNQTTVVSTKAVRHYGVSAMNVYDPQRDHGQARTFWPNDGTYRVAKMSWFIHMGADLNRDETIRFPFYRTLEKNFSPYDLIFTNELSFSETPLAPEYPGSDVKTCCTVRSDLSLIRRGDLLRRRGADGKVYFDVHYQLVVSTAHANLKFSLEFNGTEMGSVEATYV